MTDHLPEPAPTSRTIPPDLKILLAAAGMVGLVVVGVALAVMFLVAVRTGADEVERHARYSAAIDAAALHAKGMATNERGFLIDGDEDFIAQLEGRSELVRTAFATAIETADEGQRATVVEAREGFERWLDTVEEVFAVYRSGDEDAAIELSLGQARNQRWTYEGWLADAKTLGVQGFQDAATSVDGISNLSMIVLFGYLILAAVGAVIIALWAMPAVRRSLAARA